jgi:hypothetical protein
MVRSFLLGSCAVLVVLAVVAVMLHPPLGWTSGMTTSSPFSEEETRGLAGVCGVGWRPGDTSVCRQPGAASRMEAIAALRDNQLS